MAKSFKKDDWEELARNFNVSPETSEQYCQFYDEVILPRIQKKYLSALISVVEDLINMKIREEICKHKINNDKAEKEADPDADIFVYVRAQTSSHYNIFLKRVRPPNLRPCDHLQVI